MRHVKRRAVVLVSDLNPSGKGHGGRARLWAYGYPDLAVLLGTTSGALRARAQRGSFDPGDLAAVCRAWAAAEEADSSPRSTTNGIAEETTT